MQQRDYILREIERFGKILQILLARFTKQAQDGDVEKEIDAVRLELLNELDFDINDLPVSGQEKISLLLKNNPKLSYEHLDKIGDLLAQIVVEIESKNFSLAQELTKKSLLIRSYIAEKKPMYFFMKENNLRKEN